MASAITGVKDARFMRVRARACNPRRRGRPELSVDRRERSNRMTHAFVSITLTRAAGNFALTGHGRDQAEDE
jgi:hypothetical protein